jgi:hypothetical protein
LRIATLALAAVFRQEFPDKPKIQTFFFSLSQISQIFRDER